MFSSACSETQFTCPSTGQCIDDYLYCDGRPDCPQAEDEAGCTCQFETDWACASGYCIDASYVCDGVIDCYDLSDESACSKYLDLTFPLKYFLFMISTRSIVHTVISVMRAHVVSIFLSFLILIVWELVVSLFTYVTFYFKISKIVEVHRSIIYIYMKYKISEKKW